MHCFCRFLVIFLIHFIGNDSIYADGIEQASSSSYHDSSSLITSEQLREVATNCRNSIIQIHQHKNQVLKEKQREYSITLGIAAERCEALTRVFQEVQKATHDYKTYMENLQHAQNCSSTHFDEHPMHTTSQPEQGMLNQSSSSVPSNNANQSITQEPLADDQGEPTPLH